MTAAPEQHADAQAARRFARMWLRVELASVLSTNFLRPATGLIAGPAVIFTVMLTPTFRLVLNSAAALVVALFGGCAIATVLYSCSAVWIETRSFAAAPRRWLLPIGHGWAGAYAKPDRQGRMTLYSVWASPRGQHVGTALLGQICTEMDDAGLDLQLMAVNGAVASFYRTFGFEQVGQGRFARRMLRPRAARRPDC